MESVAAVLSEAQLAIMIGPIATSAKVLRDWMVNNVVHAKGRAFYISARVRDITLINLGIGNLDPSGRIKSQ